MPKEFHGNSRQREEMRGNARRLVKTLKKMRKPLETDGNLWKHEERMEKFGNAYTYLDTRGSASESVEMREGVEKPDVTHGFA